MKYVVRWSFLGSSYTREFDCLVDAVSRARYLAKGLAGTSASLVVVEVLSETIDKGEKVFKDLEHEL